MTIEFHVYKNLKGSKDISNGIISLVFVYDKLFSMNKSISCGAQDMLEAVIVQKRRINLTVTDDKAETCQYNKVLPVDMGSLKGHEFLTFMTADNQGGILKLTVNTSDIISFEADDFKDPRIEYFKS